MDFLNPIFDKYGLAAGSLFVIIENIGIPFPVEFVYLYAQNLVLNSQFSLWFLATLFAFCHTFGAIISYCIGSFGNGFISKRFMKSQKMKDAKLQIEKWYGSYGSVTSFIVRFIGYVRPWSSFIAGFGKQNFLPFVLWTLLGSFGFNIIVLLFSGLILNFWNSYQWAKIVILCGFAFFFVGIWFLFPYIKKRFKILNVR